MKITVSVLLERADYLLKELKDSARVIEEKDGFVRIEVDIQGSEEVLGLFHAGIRCGLKY